MNTSGATKKFWIYKFYVLPIQSTSYLQGIDYVQI